MPAHKAISLRCLNRAYPGIQAIAPDSESAPDISLLPVKSLLMARWYAGIPPPLGFSAAGPFPAPPVPALPRRAESRACAWEHSTLANALLPGRKPSSALATRPTRAPALPSFCLHLPRRLPSEPAKSPKLTNRARSPFQTPGPAGRPVTVPGACWHGSPHDRVPSAGESRLFLDQL